MSMRKSSLLVFDGICPSNYLSKKRLIDDIFEELFQVNVEDSCNQIRSIGNLLARIEFSFDLWPVGVASKSDKEIWFSHPYNYGHRIIIALSHISFTSLERTWQLDILSYFYCLSLLLLPFKIYQI